MPANGRKNTFQDLQFARKFKDVVACALISVAGLI